MVWLNGLPSAFLFFSWRTQERSEHKHSTLRSQSNSIRFIMELGYIL